MCSSDLDGVDKRIDVLATVIRFNGTVQDLIELELAYAPPYSSAKDPVNMVGFVADNLMKNMTDQILCQEFVELDPKDYVVLDIRKQVERDLGTIEGSVHIPIEELRNRIDELDKDANYIILCSIGLRGYLSDRILKDHGFKSKNLVGGFKTYKTLYMKDKAPIDSNPQLFSDSGVQEATVGK